MAAGYTYHMEALRKTQVLQRKHEAQTRIREANAYGENTSGNANTRLTNDNELAVSNYSSSNDNFLLLSGCGVDVRPVASAHWQTQYKAVKRNEKILRDNNMVMGPLSAFLPVKGKKHG